MGKIEERITVGMTILELVLKYGVPATLKILAALETDNPTAEDIRALADRVPHPDTYEEE